MQDQHVAWLLSFVASTSEPTSGSDLSSSGSRRLDRDALVSRTLTELRGAHLWGSRAMSCRAARVCAAPHRLTPARHGQRNLPLSSSAALAAIAPVLIADTGVSLIVRYKGDTEQEKTDPSSRRDEWRCACWRIASAHPLGSLPITVPVVCQSEVTAWLRPCR